MGHLLPAAKELRKKELLSLVTHHLWRQRKWCSDAAELEKSKHHKKFILHQGGRGRPANLTLILVKLAFLSTLTFIKSTAKTLLSVFLSDF